MEAWTAVGGFLLAMLFQWVAAAIRVGLPSAHRPTVLSVELSKADLWLCQRRGNKVRCTPLIMPMPNSLGHRCR